MRIETSKRIRELESEVGALKRIVELTFWMSRRYASGRQTYAPGMVREAWNIIQTRFKGQLRQSEKWDVTVGEPSGFDLEGTSNEDNLSDCMDSL